MLKLLTRTLNIGGFLIVLYASYLLILLSIPYLQFERNIDFLSTKQLIYHIKIWRFSFYTHVFSSPLVILSGLLQFNKTILRRSPKVHRTIGKVYVFTVLAISGPSAFVMALYANGGRITQTSFVILTSLWILFTYLAFVRIKSKKIEAHINWMIRSYALTLSAVTLRTYAYLFDIFRIDLSPKEMYCILAYASWIPNLLIAEVIIKLRRKKPYLDSETNSPSISED